MRFKYLVFLGAIFVVFVTASDVNGRQGSTLNMRAVMSQGEYTASGIGGLNPNQQALLDRWLNQWTASAMSVSCGGTYPNTEEKQSIEENADGKILILEDGSMWLVESVDQVDSALWLATEDVIVVEAKRPVGKFKYTIINTEESSEHVLARYLGQN